MKACPGTWAINTTGNPQHSAVLTPYILTPNPTETKFFTVTDVCSALFGIPVDKESQNLFAFTWEELKSIWTVMPQDFSESFSLFTNFKLIWTTGGFLQVYLVPIRTRSLCCSPSQTSPQRGNVLPLKGHKISEEKLQFAQTQVRYSGALISEPGLDLDPGRPQGFLNILKPKTKHQWRGFLGLADYCRNWIPNFLLQLNLYCFTENQ